MHSHNDGYQRQHGSSGWFMVFVLTLAYTASFIDRQVLNLFVAPIKATYHLDDTRLSLLQGLAFSVAYVAMSPIFGRLVDVGSRRGILTFGVVSWSAGTAACGFARNFGQLFAARLAVGGAEACLTPASWSIIADSFPASRVPRAFSIFMMAPYIGGGLALIFGGVLLKHCAGLVVAGWALAPWQWVFVLIALPGVVIAVLVRTLREPARRGGQGDAASFAESWQVLVAGKRFYLNFYGGMAQLLVVLYCFPAWMPAMLMRRFAVTPAVVGLQYGSLVLVCGTLGVLSGPWLADWLARRGRTDQLVYAPFCCTVLLIPVSGALLMVSSYREALLVAALAAYLYSLPQALASSALQLVTPGRTRGLASAIYVFAVTVVGLALAPTVVALLTDHVFGDDMQVGASLGITCMVAAATGAVLLWRALPGYRQMTAAARP